MSEKMDGVRAFWNGQKLVSRHGRVLSCPGWYILTLPKDSTLDGELWMGRSTSHCNIMKVLNSKSGDWTRITYYIFDIPDLAGTYEERMKQMEEIKPRLPPHVRVIENIKCRGIDHLNQHLGSIVGAQGEGVILRQPNTNNVIGYTTSLLKVKVLPPLELANSVGV